jgi:hypothetical protein
MNKRDNMRYSTIQISSSVKDKVKKYCDKNGLTISKFVEKILNDDLPSEISEGKKYRIVKNEKTNQWGIQMKFERGNEITWDFLIKRDTLEEAIRDMDSLNASNWSPID